MKVELSRADLQKLLEVVARWDRVVDEMSFCSAVEDLRRLVDIDYCALVESATGQQFEIDRDGAFCACGVDGLPAELGAQLLKICGENDVVLSCGAAAVISVPLRTSSGSVGAMWLAARSFSERDVALVAGCAPFIAGLLGRLGARHASDATMQRKDAFLRQLGHDLRSPLSTMYAAIEAMKLGGDRTEGMHLIERQLSYMTRLAQGASETSQIARGAVTLDLDPVDLPLLVDLGLERAAAELRSRGHSVVVDSPRASLFILADLDRMANVVRKLVCSVSRRCDSGESISVVIARENESAVLRVAKKPKMILRGLAEGSGGWAPLDRAEPAGSLDSELRMVQEMVELHGGTLESSKLDVTELVVTLPRTRIATSEHAIAPARVETRAQPLRVLVVEDDADLAHIVGTVLVAQGHTVEIVHDGESALGIVEDFAPDVVLMNIGLPGISGYEVAGAIRQRALSRPPRLIAITGFGAAEDIERARSAGFERHLLKPVSFREMANVFASGSQPHS